MSEVKNPARIKLNNVRIAFPALYEPKAQTGDDGKPGKLKYGAGFILDPKASYIAEIEAAIAYVAKQKWGEKADQVLTKLKEDKRIGFKRGPRTNKDGEAYDGYEGMFSLNATNEVKPTLLVGREPAGPGVIFGGCYVNGSIEAWAQDNTFGRRVNFSLRGVQFAKEGDSFGGGRPAKADEFEDISATEDDLVG